MIFNFNKKEKVMADLNNVHELNVKGTFFCTAPDVDDGCIQCGLCPSQVPEVFGEDEDGSAYVHTQPSNELIELVEEAILDCPVESIGKR